MSFIMVNKIDNINQLASAASAPARAAGDEVMELLHRLNGHGMSLPLTAITVDECARAIFQALHGAEGK